MRIKFTVTKMDWKKGDHCALTCPFAIAIARAVSKTTGKTTPVQVDGMYVWIGEGWVDHKDRVLLDDDARWIIRQWDIGLVHPDKAQTFQIDVPDHLLTRKEAAVAI